MAENATGHHRPVPATSAGKQGRRLAAPVRYLLIILAGAAVAAFTSYLLRTIGF